MKDKILALAKGNFIYEPVKLQLSKDELRLVVVSGKTVSETFTIQNARHTKVKGFLTTTSQIELTPQTFNDEEVEVTVTVPTELEQAGMTLTGTIEIITDCGETSIPYKVEVQPPVLADEKGEVTDFHELDKRISDNLEESALLFHSANFKNTLLYRDEPATYLYNHLVKRDSKLHSFDEFMVATGKKKAFHFRISQTRFVYDLKQETVKEYLTVTANTWGAACIHVYSNDKFILPQVETIWSDDFKKGKFELTFEVSAKRLKDGKHTGKLILETPYQREEVTIILSKKTSIMPVDQYLHEKKYLWAAYKNLLNYRMGKMRQEEYLNNIAMVLEELFDSESDFVAFLRSYLAAMQQKVEDCEEFCEMLQTYPRPDYSDDTHQILKYLSMIYVRSLYTKTESDRQLVALEARDFYENGFHIWPVLYLLMQVEDRYQTLTPQLLLQEVNEFLEKGCHSPLLYLEAVKIYKKDPALLHQLTKTSIQVIYWGTKEELFDREFALTLSFLAEHIRSYSDIVYRTLLLQYKKYRLDDTLHSICSMLIRCEKMNHEYFPWFALGVKKHLRITELYEYFMYTYDLEHGGEIPQSVFTYFQYENHLNDKIKAFLFAQIVKGREKKPEIFEAYRESMTQFALRQLSNRRLNENLGVLYQELLKEENIRDDIATLLPQVMFKQHLYCENEHMEGVYVVHMESEKEQYYSIVNGQAHIDLYTPNYQLYFVDRDNRYYVKTVKYRLEKMTDLEKYAIKCYENGSTDPKLLIHLFHKIDKRFVFKQKDAMICHQVIKLHLLSDYHQGHLFLRLFDHYMEVKDDGMIRQILEEMDLNLIKSERRGEIIQTIAQYNLFEKAYEAVCQYGLMDIDHGKMLRVLDWKLRQTEEYDVFLFKMCHGFYLEGYKTDLSVAYLLKYFMGPMKQFFKVFSDCWLQELPIEDEVCEKLLAQVLFINENPTSYYQIFYDYYMKGLNRVLVKAFLSYIAYQYIVEKVELTDDLMLMLEKEAASTDSRVMQLAILRKYSTVAMLDEKQKEYIDFHVSRLVKEGIIMKFMQDFRGRVTLPYIIENAVLIEYFISTDLPVNLLVYDEEGEMKTYQMKQVFPGVFVKEFLIFEGEEFRYQIYAEEKGRKTRRAVLKTPANTSEDGSFYALVNRMITAKESNDSDAYRRECSNYQKYQEVAKKLLRPILS